MYTSKPQSPPRLAFVLMTVVLVFAASFAAPIAVAFTVDTCDDHCEDACETCCDCIHCVPSLYMMSVGHSSSGLSDAAVSWWLHSTPVHPDGVLSRGIDRPPQLSL